MKNLPANTGDKQVWSPGQEDPLEEGMATHSSILAWRIPMETGAWQATVHGFTKSRTQLSDLSCTHLQRGCTNISSILLSILLEYVLFYSFKSPMP